jgi:hypothetical protein
MALATFSSSVAGGLTGPATGALERAAVAGDSDVPPATGACGELHAARQAAAQPAISIRMDIVVSS